eukprot:12933077-Prorocentrum_lima.AAC.1
MALNGNIPSYGGHQLMMRVPGSIITFNMKRSRRHDHPWHLQGKLGSGMLLLGYGAFEHTVCRLRGTVAWPTQGRHICLREASATNTEDEARRLPNGLGLPEL